MPENQLFRAPAFFLPLDLFLELLRVFLVPTSIPRLPVMVLGVLMLATPVAAADHPPEFFLKTEGGAGIPLLSPQRDFFRAGFVGQLKLGIGFFGFLDFHVVGMLGAFPATALAPSNDASVPGGLGGGLRLRLPYTFEAVPWVDLDLLWIRTGGLDRFSYTVGGGVHFALDQAHRWRMGPFVRFWQITNRDGVGFNDVDALILAAGVSIELGSAQAVAAPRCPACNEPAPVVAVADRDGDRVPDGDDACPAEAGTFATQGCPDRDGDGIADASDRCPEAAGPAASNGCPDRDGDRVPDGDDRCPDVGGDVDAQGCPQRKDITVTDEKVEIRQKIQFATNKAEVLPASYPLLDALVATLDDRPKLRLRVEGHTDDRGAAEHNRRLSEARSKAVMDYLVAKGIAANRLEAKGFGPERPLAPNLTSAGREANRRVEFVVLEERSAP